MNRMFGTCLGAALQLACACVFGRQTDRQTDRQTRTHTHTHKHADTHAHTQTHTHTPGHEPPTHSPTHTHTHTLIHTRIRTHTHAHTHKRAHTLNWLQDTRLVDGFASETAMISSSVIRRSWQQHVWHPMDLFARQ